MNDALELVRLANQNHARAASRMTQAEQDRARAVWQAKQAGASLRAIGEALGTSHVRALQLSRWAEASGLVSAEEGPRPAEEVPVASTEPDPSATRIPACPHERTATEDRCALCGRTGRQVAELGEVMIRRVPLEPGVTEPESSATVPCARLGCRAPALSASRFCGVHARY